MGVKRKGSRRALVLVVLLGLVFVAASVGSVFTSRSVSDWYVGLAKPSWTPPGWVFGPVWTVLYVLMAAAAWRVWLREGLARGRLPLALFAVQLVLNAAWSGVFFGLRMPGLALAELAVLLAAVAATTAAFWRADRLAGALMLPYLGWATFAGALNLAIWRMNA
jgi:tryptophan-rich sensory protein